MDNTQKNTTKNIWSRGMNKIYSSLIQPLKEKEFTSSESQMLRYMFFPEKRSRILLVGFQACNDNGARYNYVRTVAGCGVNRLFIKDDFGINHWGDYYLGCDGTYSVERAVIELIDKFRDKVKPDRLIFIGSSKGGYAALNFGLRYENIDMIVAAPQYYLADYLDSDKFRKILDDILGSDVTDEKKAQLNIRLREVIKQDKYESSQRVFIHYSTQEHTYREHVADLLHDLKDKGIPVQEDVGDYQVHGDLKYYFPQYLQTVINKIQKNN